MTGLTTGTRGWGWLDHLRSGGTTPWSMWQGTAPVGTGRLPSAQHLELLRLVNVAAGRPPSPDLARRILTAPTTGRGRGDLGLLGEPGAAFGPAPIDPSRLRPGDIVVIAASALARDLVDHAPRRLDVEPLRRVRLVRRWGRVRRVELLAGPYDTVLADAWAAACFSGVVPPWVRWLERARRNEAVPPRADLVRIAHNWAGEVGAENVVVVVTDPVRSSLPSVLAGSAAAAGLARQVRLALSVSVPTDRRTALLGGPLLEWLGRLPGSVGEPAAVPGPLRAWAAAEADRQRAGLEAAGYSVVGDVARLHPTATGSTLPAHELTLDLAVRLLVMRGEHS